MNKIALASTAIFAARALAQGAGNAIVINKCSYDVLLSNTPSAGGGFNAIDQTLSSGGSYSQPYTQLSNSNGWSLKLSKNGNFLSDVLQYEYTFHDDGIIWYDLSEVDGNPWDGNWEITATGDCTPRQAAYRFATDDAYGMQSCPQGSSVTVTLCSGDSEGGSSSPVESPPSVPTPSIPSPTWGAAKVVAPAGDATLGDKADSSPAPTPENNWNGPAVTVTNLKMETVTRYVTATAAAEKRHMHHPRHPHHRL